MSKATGVFCAGAVVWAGMSFGAGIALPDDPGEVASYAAAEIRDYVKKATGESWTVVTNAPVGQGVAFRFVEDRKLGEDGFRLREQGGVLTIEASKKRGCLYGAYEYLERFAGVRWYSSDTERVPKLAKIDVPKGFQLESKPDFLMRDAHWYDIAHDGDFAARMRNNANAPLQAKHGGLPYRFGRGVWACHTFCRLMPSDEFFVKHPEYYGLKNGKRSGENQLCLTNPDVLRIVTERIKDRIKKDPGARFYGVSQDDHQNYCECENCAKVDAEEGSHAGCIVRFVNAVAEAVEKEYPDAIIETLAYNYSRFPTKKTKFRHNVTPCVCSIECGFGPDPIEKGTTEFNRQFIKCLEGWGKQTEEIYLWDYTTNFKDYYHFMPNLNVLQDNLRFFRKNGVKYMFEQGNTQGRHGFMAEMKTYLLSKWMWNADLDAETLVKDFTDGYYGAGGKYVRQFLAELEAYFADYCRKHSDFSALIYEEATAGVYDEGFLRRAESLWQMAEDAALASGDAIALRNVRAGRMSTAFERFVKTPNSVTAEQLDALATECGSRRWSEGGARTSEYELKLQKALPRAREWEVPGWDLVWQDEFNGTSVDGSNWHHEHGFVRNKELQYYTKDRRENCRVENGCLVLEARKEKYVDPETDAKAEYTSASLKSDWRFTFMYGRIDVRAKVPAGLGVWPAAWTLGADIKTQRWPWCGEIDIMEYVGHAPNRVWGTAHWSDKTVDTANGHKSSGGHLDLPAPLSDDFHVYSMTWDKEKITFSIDGRQYHEVKLADMQPNVRDWPPFGQYHYLILNLAYGGAWGGQKGVDDACLPAKYLVDYVRAYKPAAKKPTVNARQLVDGAWQLYWRDRNLEGARQLLREAGDDRSAKDMLELFADEPDGSRQLAFAERELTNWVAKISGKAPDLGKFVLGTPASNPEAAAFAKRHADDFAKLEGNDGFILAEENGRVYIVAAKTKGVLNGVYRFLERNSDIIWVRPFAADADDGCGTVYTKNPDFKNTVRYLCDVPSVPVERFFYGFHNWPDALWQARNLGSSACGWDGNCGVGRYQTYVTLGDPTTFTACIGLDHVSQRYGKTDPDVLPLVNGVRKSYHDCQLCFMNPKTLELFCREAERAVRAMPKKVRWPGIGLGDNWDVCNCEMCMKPIALPDGTVVEPKDPNFRSTQYALFVNAISAYLQKRFPHLEPMPTMSYIFCAEPPAVPVAGGAGLYCPYVKNHKKPVYDDAANKTWHDKAEGFFRRGFAFGGVYEYYLCTSTPLFYHAISEVAQKDLQYYLKRNPGTLRKYYNDVSWTDNGATNNEASVSKDVSAIEFWTVLRLAWDANADVKELRREFCRRAYHEAAPIMIEYYEKMAANYNDDPAGCFWNDDPVSAAKHYVVEKGLAGWMRETLAKAERTARDPRSKELIRRHRERILAYVDKAEKSPKKVTLVVPQILDERPSSDPDAPFWRKAAEVGPITAIKTSKPEPKWSKTTFRVAHDRKNLYLMMTSRSENVLKKVRAFRDAYGKPWKEGEPYQWDSPFELYLDGDLGRSGGYYMFSMMYTGRKWASRGTTFDPSIRWTADLSELRTHDGVSAFVTWPLDQIGVDISKGNKLGAMFLSNWGAWNGGQWHSPTGFQTLMLEMK